jgi:hypothetical protein
VTGRWICYILAVILSLSTMAIVLVETLFRLQVRPALDRNRAIERAYFEPYNSDLQFLARSPLFPTTRAGQNDAGIFLNPKIFWAPKPTLRARGTVAPIVPIATREALLRMRDEWMKKNSRAKMMKADLTIFTGLSRFDYWDIENESPIGDLAERHQSVVPAQLPVPEVSDLLAAVKIRLMLGASNGEADFVPALSDVRSLAQLMLTTENQQLVISGLAALDAERFAYQYFVDERHMPPGSWVPMDRNLLRRANRAVVATRGFMHLWTAPEMLEQAYLKGAPAAGFCAAINEAFPLEIALRPRLEPHWPLEINLRAEYAQLDAIYRRAHAVCRLRYLGELMSHDSIKAVSPGPLILNVLPYSRKVFALRLSILNFRGFAEYAGPATP